MFQLINRKIGVNLCSSVDSFIFLNATWYDSSFIVAPDAILPLGALSLVRMVLRLARFGRATDPEGRENPCGIKRPDRLLA